MTNEEKKTENTEKRGKMKFFDGTRKITCLVVHKCVVCSCVRDGVMSFAALLDVPNLYCFESLLYKLPHPALPPKCRYVGTKTKKEAHIPTFKMHTYIFELFTFKARAVYEIFLSNLIYITYTNPKFFYSFLFFFWILLFSFCLSCEFCWKY